MRNKCRQKLGRALATAAFAAVLYIAGSCLQQDSESVISIETGEEEQMVSMSVNSGVANRIQMLEIPQRIDLKEEFELILSKASEEFTAGYKINKAFLLWLGEQYGDEAVLALADSITNRKMNEDMWYEATGSSMHVLWVSYCKSAGIQSKMLENVYWTDCKDADETVISFTGDFNFAEGWCTTEYMEEQPDGIYDCFSKKLLDLMKESDVLMMNNEFVYSDRGEALRRKAYTFRADPKKAALLSVFGADIVNLGNNHVYDYGEEALLDTLEILKDQEIAYVGAGKDIEEASKIVYYVANGRKIAVVSATEIERSIQYTKEATEDSAGVLKTLKPEKFIAVIEEARAVSDYVIVLPHWGTEGSLYPDASQRKLAKAFVEAGADAVIGNHPHRLQGVEFYNEVPVAYSLGNFWFSDAALYTTVVQAVIGADGDLQLKYLPCIQKGLTTSLITDKTEIDDFYHYLAAISSDIGIDAEGRIYPKTASGYEPEVVYDADTSKTSVTGRRDLEGRAIDIVGNLR